jgi:hypothetical protein
LYLFNLVGFRWVFDYARHQSDKQFSAQLEGKQFDEKDLITVRVPLFMPYQAANKGFERASGEVTIAGTVYKYVGRKIDNGELVLYCLRDERGSSLLNARDTYYSETNGLACDGPSQDNHSTNNSSNAPGFNLGDYDDFVAGYTLPMDAPAILYAVPSNDVSILHRDGSLPERPPESGFTA